LPSVKVAVIAQQDALCIRGDSEGARWLWVPVTFNMNSCDARHHGRTSHALPRTPDHTQWNRRSVNDVCPLKFEPQFASVPSQIRIRLPGPQYGLDYSTGLLGGRKVSLHFARQFSIR